MLSWNGKGLIAAIACLTAMVSAGVAATGSHQHRAVYRTSAQVYGGQEEDGRLWFSTWDTGGRYTADDLSPERLDQLQRVLMTAIDAGRSLAIEYDASRGRWNEQAGRIDYPLCAVSLDELSFTSTRPCPQSALVQLSDEARLSLGHAEARDGSPVTARVLLEPLIASKAGTAGFRKIALEARADALEALADRAPSNSRAADAALVLSLSDLRTVAAAHPEDVEAQLRVANRLRDLGDYDAAEAEFRKVIARWPDQEERVGVSLALVARTRGDAQGSLDILDGIVAKHGRQDGMRFNYHRAWSLNRLGRFDEAVAALTDGIKHQPDYAWAYIYRACAYANLAKLDDALADVDTAIDILAKLPTGEESPTIRSDRERLQDVQRSLKDAVTAGPKKPMPEICGGFGDDGEKPRPRSPLLDAAAQVLERELANRQ